LLLLAGPALAQQTTDDHASHHRSAASDATEAADGEVRRIDKDARKLTLRHGEIRNLDMPRMTMVFQVRDAALLDKVKVGDKVKFRAEKVGPDFVVTAIEAVK
jgi:Cu/Ag efflux protein CusF